MRVCTGISMLSSQRSLRLAPQVRQGNASTCLGVSSLDFIPHDEALQNGKLVNCEQTRGKEYGFIWGGATNTFVYLNVLDTVVSSPAPSRE